MANALVTVVSGLPRSGTSLMMQMIHAGGIPALTDQVRANDDDNPRGYYEFEAVKRTRTDRSWVASAEGRVVKLVHLLLLDLPPGRTYQVVMMRRDLPEVLASQQKMLTRQGRRGANLPPEQLMKLFSDQMANVKRAISARSDMRVLEVAYGDVINDPAGQARRINVFLGGQYDESAMAAAVDPALYRNRAP